jgi:hypothetical protein
MRDDENERDVAVIGLVDQPGQVMQVGFDRCKVLDEGCFSDAQSAG